MKSNGKASDNPRRVARDVQDEAAAGERAHAESTQAQTLLARVLERENLQRALKKVRQNQGAPGIDGRTVDELPQYLKHHWPEIREQIVAGTYRPQPVRRVGERTEATAIGVPQGGPFSPVLATYAPSPVAPVAAV